MGKPRKRKIELTASRSRARRRGVRGRRRARIHDRRAVFTTNVNYFVRGGRRTLLPSNISGRRPLNWVFRKTFRDDRASAPFSRRHSGRRCITRIQAAVVRVGEAFSSFLGAMFGTPRAQEVSPCRHSGRRGVRQCCRGYFRVGRTSDRSTAIPPRRRLDAKCRGYVVQNSGAIVAAAPRIVSRNDNTS